VDDEPFAYATPCHMIAVVCHPAACSGLLGARELGIRHDRTMDSVDPNALQNTSLFSKN
jgi:hypothetical protein